MMSLARSGLVYFKTILLRFPMFYNRKWQLNSGIISKKKLWYLWELWFPHSHVLLKCQHNLINIFPVMSVLENTTNLRLFWRHRIRWQWGNTSKQSMLIVTKHTEREVIQSNRQNIFILNTNLIYFCIY